MRSAFATKPAAASTAAAGAEPVGLAELPALAPYRELERREHAYNLAHAALRAAGRGAARLRDATSKAEHLAAELAAARTKKADALARLHAAAAAAIREADDELAATAACEAAPVAGYDDGNASTSTGDGPTTPAWLAAWRDAKIDLAAAEHAGELAAWQLDRCDEGEVKGAVAAVERAAEELAELRLAALAGDDLLAEALERARARAN